MGVLANHVPSIEQLKPGLVEIIEESGGSKQFFCTSFSLVVIASRCRIAKWRKLLEETRPDWHISSQEWELYMPYKSRPRHPVENEILPHGRGSKADSPTCLVSGGFAIVQPGSQLSINAVEGFSLGDFSADVGLLLAH